MLDQRKSELAEQVRESLTYGRQLAGEDLLMKSRLLFTGLHWWYRGRYGAGSDSKALTVKKVPLQPGTAPALGLKQWCQARNPGFNLLEPYFERL